MTPDGRAAWAAIVAERGGYDPTIEVTTPSGGKHVYFRYNAARPLGNKEGALAGKGIDVRGDGGYIVLPPSRRLDGKAYVANMPFDRAALADAPEWLFEAINGRKKAERKPWPNGANPAAGQADSAAGPDDEASAAAPGAFPYTPTNADKLREALGHVPADNRSMWFRIGAALHALGDDWGDASRELWDTWSQTSDKFESDDQDKTWNGYDDSREDSATVGTIFFEAHVRGWASDKGESGVGRNDFVAYLPDHLYIYRPTSEMWPGSSVNAIVAPVPLVDAHGNPILDERNKRKNIPASQWIDKHAHVEQMTWCPGLPQLICDKLVDNGGWIERADVTTYNLYRPPTIVPGDPMKADPWIAHVCKIYPNEASHIIKFFAHRIQFPGVKINHGLLLGSDKFGVGKDTLLEPVKRGVGPWNFADVTPAQVMGRFNGFVKSVVLRINEVRDSGEYNRYLLYDHLKLLAAAPPDIIRCDEKNRREHGVFNVTSLVLTTNHRDAFYLPADDRRYYVAWTEAEPKDFGEGYWNELWSFYKNGGYEHVVAYLTSVDLTDFDAAAPPPKTPAFWMIVDAGRSAEEGELADVIEEMGSPQALTLKQITAKAPFELREWLEERGNRRVIPHRLQKAGYVPIRNDSAEDGQWVISGKRQAIYVAQALPIRLRLVAARALVEEGRSNR
jgi:Bifunctional DNA primase/polymerase, N-terminal/Primase C terminal 2 (PriCT-2)/Family of unknown function (DUF5906)